MKNERARRSRILFICGSLNQTTQLHQVSRQLPECKGTFTPYYGHAGMELLNRLGLLEGTIAGDKLRQRCLDYLVAHRLSVDLWGRNGGYDLVVTCSDVVVPRNISGIPLVAVQEGILDPDGLGWQILRRFPRAPLWLAGTGATGLSGKYQRFCVASQGYRDLFVRRGAPAERLVVTGLPNFDHCESFRQNDFSRRGYVLVCTSDTRETLKLLDDRKRFITWARGIAGRRPTIFKLHPNERAERSRREIARWFPDAEVLVHGNTDSMIANCDVLITQFSSTVFVGLALDKEVHSYHPIEELRRLMPEQHGEAALRIAQVCREVLSASGPHSGAITELAA